jgi:hypothetical protein
MILVQLWDSKQAKWGLISNLPEMNLGNAIANSQKIPEHHPHRAQTHNK